MSEKEKTNSGGPIRLVNDFVLGCFTAVLSLALIFGKVTSQEVKTGQGGFMARPDIWIKFMACILLVVSIVLIVRALNFKHAAEIEKWTFYLDATQVGTIICLIAYTALLPVLGFFITTFLATFYLCLLYTVKERRYSFRTVPKDELPKILIRAAIISALLLVVFWFVFGRLLRVALPSFELFYLLGMG